MRPTRPDRPVRLIPIILVAAFTAVGTASAQTTAEIRDRYRVPVPDSIAVLLGGAARSQPGSSSGSPAAFGAGWGDFFVGAGFQARTRYSDDEDGSAVVGFGLGNARRLIGMEVALTSGSTIRSGFFERTSVSFKVNRILPRSFGVAVGYENAVTFGDGADGGRSLYGVISKVWDPSSWSPLLSTTTTLGVGGGRFLPEDELARGDDGGANIFASIGVQVFEPMSVIADWTGQDLTIAASIVPFRRLPLVITPGVADLTGRAGDGARFIIGAGVGLHIKQMPGALFR